MDDIKLINCPLCGAEGVLPMSDNRCPNCKGLLDTDTTEGINLQDKAGNDEGTKIAYPKEPAIWKQVLIGSSVAVFIAALPFIDIYLIKHEKPTSGENFMHLMVILASAILISRSFLPCLTFLRGCLSWWGGFFIGYLFIMLKNQGQSYYTGMKDAPIATIIGALIPLAACLIFGFRTRRRQSFNEEAIACLVLGFITFAFQGKEVQFVIFAILTLLFGAIAIFGIIKSNNKKGQIKVIWGMGLAVTTIILVCVEKIYYPDVFNF